MAHIGEQTLAPDRTGMIRVAVLASGNGTNAENIIQHAAKHPDRITIPLVITDNKGAGVIKRAEKLGIPCAILPVNREDYPDHRDARQAQEDRMLDLCKAENVNWLFLAGYMRLLRPSFLQHFYDPRADVNRVVNVHPSLLPEFAGKDANRRAYDSGTETAGVTLHFVDDGMDTGPIIAQKSFARGTQSFEEFCATGQALEHELYSEFMAQLLDGSWHRFREKATA